MRFALVTSASFLAFGVSTSAPAATIFEHSAFVFAADTKNLSTVFSAQKFTFDGSPATASGYSDDGFASAQATKANNGTAIATASGINYEYGSTAFARFETLFDFSPSTKGKIVLKLIGWAIANGSGIGRASSSIYQNGVRVGSAFAFSTEMTNFGPAAPGFRKLSLVKTLNWKGGDTIAIQNIAEASVYGLTPTSATGPGFASVYVDPVIDVSISSVPEPASWAMLIAGFGLTGAAMRRRAVAVARS